MLFWKYSLLPNKLVHCQAMQFVITSRIWGKCVDGVLRSLGRGKSPGGRTEVVPRALSSGPEGCCVDGQSISQNGEMKQQ